MMLADLLFRRSEFKVAVYHYQQLLERNRLSRIEGSPYREVRLYEALRPAPDRTVFVAGSYLDFQRPIMAAMYRAGQRAASDWLALGPPIDRLDPRTNVEAQAQASG